MPRSPLPLPAPPKRTEASAAGRAIERVVEEGPVELSDPGRVSVDLGADEHLGGDADIIWNDAIAEPTKRRHHQSRRRQDHRAIRSTSALPAPPTPPLLLRPKRRRRSPAGALLAAGGASQQSTAAGRRQDRTTEPRTCRLMTISGAAPRRGSQSRSCGWSGRRGRPRAGDQTPQRQLRTLNRWLLVVVPIVVITTVAWRYWQNVRQQYPQIAEKGRNEGIPALEAGEFDKAHQLLSAAKSAVDSLGGAVNDADEIRQAADEAAVFVNLVTKGLDELLDEAGHATDPDSWASRFRKRAQGPDGRRGFDRHRTPGEGGSSSYELAVRILPRGEASNRDGRPERVGVFDLTGFELFDSRRRRPATA